MKLVSVKEAAAALGVAPATVRRWLEAGAPHLQWRRGGVVRIDLNRLIAWLERRARRS